MRLKTVIAALVACIALGLPSTALATSPTQDAYGGIAGQQEGGGNSPSQAVVNATETSSAVPAVAVAETPASSSGTLPFTGLEVGVIAVVGLCLIGGGVALYRTSRSRRDLRA